MTPLEEYQALPDRTLDYNNIGRMYEAMGESPRAMAIEAHIDSAHAVIRLLAKALRKYGIDPHIDGPCGDKDCDECEAQAELRALLAAVERDFPEGA
jgi:hypothetical protein